MSILDILTIDDVRPLYKIHGAGHIKRAYYFMIINENILGEDFPRHEHHKYPLVTMVETKDGYIYDAIIGGRGMDTFGEALYGETESGSAWMNYFESLGDKLLDLSKCYRERELDFEKWCAEQYS